METTPAKSSGTGSSGSGLEPNVASLLCYVCTFVTGIVFLIIEKDNKQVRFHAWQAIVLGGASFVIQLGLSILGAILGAIAGPLAMIISIFVPVVWLAFLIFWIVAMVKAYQGEQYKIPFIGDIAEKQNNK
ncbi:DUF4870 domain-containing protein [bacterium]|nr:DUF4870 domain-containing protein [bacterium]